MPCFLCECSFYSNPAEEQRLAYAGYNLREAYAIYVGLCEWAQCGRPHQTAPTIKIDGSSRQLESTLSEGLPDWWGKDRSRILESSIEVKMNGKEIPHHFDPATKVLTADLPLPADARRRWWRFILRICSAITIGRSGLNVLGGREMRRRR